MVIIADPSRLQNPTWYYGNPDNWLGNENCGVINGNHNFKLNDEVCMILIIV